MSTQGSSKPYSVTSLVNIRSVLDSKRFHRINNYLPFHVDRWLSTNYLSPPISNQH